MFLIPYQHVPSHAGLVQCKSHKSSNLNHISRNFAMLAHNSRSSPHSHTSHSRDFGCHRIGRLVSQSGPMRPTCQTWARLPPQLAGSNPLGLQNLAPTFSHLPPFVIQKRFCLPLVYKFVFPLRERISPFSLQPSSSIVQFTFVQQNYPPTPLELVAALVAPL